MTSNPEEIIGSNMKFSAFAIFASNIGKPNKIVKIAVDIQQIFFWVLKSFLHKEKNIIIEKTPKINETSRIANWSEPKNEQSKYKRGGLLSNISL